MAAAAATWRSEPEFFAALARRGVRVRLRYSEHDPGQVTGYAVTMPGARTAAGEPVWFGGGKLAPDLTLPKLRQRREVAAAAAGARSEPEFFAVRSSRSGRRGGRRQIRQGRGLLRDWAARSQ